MPVYAPHFPGLVFQTPCSFHVVLRVRTRSSGFCSKHSPYLDISPALLGIMILKHYLNGAKDMALLTVLALHAGDSGLDPRTTQLGGGQELKMLSGLFISLTLQVVCLYVFREFPCVSVCLSVCTYIFCFLFDSLLFCSFVCFDF